jgi:hypothetical protein
MSGPVLTLLFLLSILTSIGQIYLGWATNKVTIQAADTQSQYFCTTFNITPTHQSSPTTLKQLN